jgi:hypothetical protein
VFLVFSAIDGHTPRSWQAVVHGRALTRAVQQPRKIYIRRISFTNTRAELRTQKRKTARAKGLRFDSAPAWLASSVHHAALERPVVYTAELRTSCFGRILIASNLPTSERQLLLLWVNGSNLCCPLR